MAIKAIIFDRHGVFDKVTGETIREKIASYTQFETAATVKEKIKDTRRQYDLWIIQPADARGIIQETFQFTEEQTQSCKDHLTIAQPIQEMRDIIPQLEKSYTLGILSDCPKDKKEYIEKHFDLSAFQFTFRSCDYAKSKSIGTDFFEMMYLYLEQNGIVEKYDEILFVDDRIENINRAKELEMHWCLFSSVHDLEKFIDL